MIFSPLRPSHSHSRSLPRMYPHGLRCLVPGFSAIMYRCNVISHAKQPLVLLPSWAFFLCSPPPLPLEHRIVWASVGSVMPSLFPGRNAPAAAACSGEGREGMNQGN